MTEDVGTAVSQDELVARSDANLRSVSKAWALACATGEAWEDGASFVTSSGINIRSFNGAYMVKVAGSELLRVRDYFQTRGVRFRVRVREDISVDDAVIHAAGFEPHRGIPSLVLSPIPLIAKPPPLEIKAVRDAESLRHHVDVVAAAFDWDPDALGKVFTERLLEDDAWHSYVGYVDGKAVATSQLYVMERVAGIDYVATLDSYRERGFGEAMTRHAIQQGAAAGCDMASLQASPVGLPIYQRMGFRRVSYYRSYVPTEA